MKENKWYNIHINANYKKENFIILNKKKIKDKKCKSNNIPENSLSKNRKLINDSKLYKLKSFPNNNFFASIFKLIIITLFYSPILAIKEIKLRKINYISEITLIINGSGDQRILGKEFKYNLSEIYVNGINQTKFDFKVYGLNKAINHITLRWDYEFKDCSYMFNNIPNIIEIDLSKLNLPKITNMLKMFQNCVSLTSINLNNLDTSSVGDMRDLFASCISLKSLNLSNFSTKSATNLGQLFYNCTSITSLDLSSFVTSKATRMDSMFAYCNSLTSLDLSNFNTSSVGDMSGMFRDCKSLKILNLGNFKTSSVNNMNRMFASCSIIISLNLKSFDTSKVTNMENMFFSIKKLTSLDLSNFVTSSVTNMNRMFNGCSSLISLNLNSFKTSSVEGMANMFDNCVRLISLNIDNFNIAKVKDMSNMFSNCPSLISLNLASFKTSSSLTKYNQMFENNNNLLKYCFIEESIPQIVSDLNNSNPNYINSCSDICFKTEQKIKFTENKECVYDCSDSLYNFEYNDICYNSCPKGTHNIENNNNLCEKCSPLTFFNKSCQIDINDLTEKSEIIKEIRDELLYDTIDNPFYELVFNTINEEKQDLIIEEENIVYQLTSSDNQNNNEYNNYSVILLGDCEKKLKEYYNINDNGTLVIFKQEYYEEGSLIPIIDYEIYYPYKNKKLNLSICEDIPIDIVIPVTINENEIYKHNLSSDYYNDICFSYTTEKGTDIILTDRKNEYYQKNLALCEDNCEFVRYDNRTRKAICQCKVKSTFTSFLDFSFDKDKLLDNIINIKNKINIYVVKCYKLLFSKKGIIKNIGSYILLIIIILNIPLGIIFIIKEYKLLHLQIDNILKSNQKGKKKYKVRGSQIFKINKKSKIRLEDKKSEIKEKKKNISSKRKSQKIDIFGSDSKTNDFINGKSNNNLKLKNDDKLIENKNINQKKTYNNKILGSSANKIKIKKFNDYEINKLTYKKAMKVDHRTFKEYYISLLKRKQILIFTFYTKDDYNSKIIKISLLLFSFALYFTINALFFSDSTMHKIYEDEGTFDFIYQIPQILYSTALSSINNALISYLSLSEKNILIIKNTKEKNKENLSKLVYEIKKCLIIKFILFFLFNFLSLIFFWYYLGCFCAVYKNTQIHLIKDTLVSFSLSLLYPFGLCLLPGIFRIKALNSKNQDKECMYNFSKLLQLI